MKKQQLTVISLGGSILVPESGLDAAFLKSFAKLIRQRLGKGEKYIIVVGGGSIARRYQKAARSVSELADEDVDWLGIHATRLNGHLLRSVFREEALHRVVKDPLKKIVWNKSLMIAAGWKPGWSTDYVAVRLARKFGGDKIINLSNIKVVYDKDPRKHKDAKPMPHFDWVSFRKMVGTEWVPGMNVPFDPIAAKAAEKWGMEVVVAKGDDLGNLKKILEGRTFVGTTIS